MTELEAAVAKAIEDRLQELIGKPCGPESVERALELLASFYPPHQRPKITSVQVDGTVLRVKGTVPVPHYVIDLVIPKGDAPA